MLSPLAIPVINQTTRADRLDEIPEKANAFGAARICTHAPDSGQGWQGRERSG